ncbi:hypothetical protein B0H14DRAFT_3699750 [Mycena olivaceomarginata]|nr:hypothetical protein B0H14DRAFT_3699750 [Mycena olivaceomarginata]
MSTPSKLPKTLPCGFLDKTGHLRHFHNLATAPLGEWPHMGTQVDGQEWLDSLRYQLATMAYAAGAAHYHHLPALRSRLQVLVGKFGGYWYLTSQSGRMADPDIKELRKPWPNPVSRENIMYSGHLLLMVSLHAMLIGDDKYDAPDALVFDWNPIFWGMGRETFSYTRMTLQDTILNEMEAENWLGVCCEPNCIFVVCNQFPLIAIRYNDARNGTNIIEGVLEKYTAAWKSRQGFLQDDGLFIQMFKVKRGDRILERGVGFTAWACAFMNAWNSEEVHALYPTQILGFLSTNAPIRMRLKRYAARASSRGRPRKRAYTRPDFGYVVQWVSESRQGRDPRRPPPPRRRVPQPDLGARAGCSTRGTMSRRTPRGTGRAWIRTPATPAIGYARLNVRDGQRKMWEAPWTPEHLANTPSGVDFLRGVWDADVGAMIANRNSNRISLVFRNLPEGTYGLYINGELFDMHSVTEAGGSIPANGGGRQDGTRPSFTTRHLLIYSATGVMYAR